MLGLQEETETTWFIGLHKSVPEEGVRKNDIALKAYTDALSSKEGQPGQCIPTEGHRPKIVSEGIVSLQDAIFRAMRVIIQGCT
jgi:hypothetical protein